MNKNIFKAFYLSTALLTTSFASTEVLNPYDVSKNMRASLNGNKGAFKTEDIAKAVEVDKTITWAESFIRFAIELCLQSLNTDKEAQAKSLTNGNEMFAKMIGASATKNEKNIKKPTDPNNALVDPKSTKNQQASNAVTTNKYWTTEDDNVLNEFEKFIEGNVVNKKSTGAIDPNHIESGPVMNFLPGTDPGCKADRLLFIDTDKKSYVIKCEGFSMETYGLKQDTKTWNDIFENYETTNGVRTLKIVNYIKDLDLNGKKYLLMEKAPGKSLANYLWPLMIKNPSPGFQEKNYPHDPKSITEEQVKDLGKKVGSQMGYFVKAYVEETGKLLYQTDSDLRNWFFDGTQLTLIDVECEEVAADSEKLSGELSMVRFFYGVLEKFTKDVWIQSLKKDIPMETLLDEKGLEYLEGVRKLLLFVHSFFNEYNEIVKDLDVHSETKLKSYIEWNYIYDYAENIKEFKDSLKNTGKHEQALTTYLFKDMTELLNDSYIDRMLGLKKPLK